jgi:hypothetical protein
MAVYVALKRRGLAVIRFDGRHWFWSATSLGRLVAACAEPKK